MNTNLREQPNTFSIAAEQTATSQNIESIAEKSVSLRAWEISDKSAWQAFESGNLIVAEQLWQKVISIETEISKLRSHYSNLGYVLVAQKRFDEAASIYRNLFNDTRNSIYLHQLCMVFREKGDLRKAVAYARQEAKLIDSQNFLFLAANAYEFGKIFEIQKSLSKAKRNAAISVEYAARTDDNIMKGCAHRLMAEVQLLELAQHYNNKPTPTTKLNLRNVVLSNLKAAKKFFMASNDKIAAREINRLVLKTIESLKRDLSL